jgi:amino acid permease
MPEEITSRGEASLSWMIAPAPTPPPPPPPAEEPTRNNDRAASPSSSTAAPNDEEARRGTISSARLNILSTMVGGGCLSLPLAFQQSGNSLLGPLLLIVIAFISDFCFRLLVASAAILNVPESQKRGKDSFESITSAAFGARAYVFSMGLVTAMCFFGTVGYCVLLRDMLEPITDSIHTFQKFYWLHHNLSMFGVILVVTPLCTLSRFTALKNCNALSMFSILILGSCIVLRSIQCNLGSHDVNENNDPWHSHIRLWPDSPREVLDALPLYISCFVCHYNILPVHNELQEPSRARVSWWLRSTTWYAAIIYLVMGFAGSMYGTCTPSGSVQGNVLLDFDEDDPLLLVGRLCLALTITLAFPMLVIPARDIVIRSLFQDGAETVVLPVVEGVTNPTITSSSIDEVQEALEEPLLSAEEQQQAEPPPEDPEATTAPTTTAAAAAAPTTTTSSFALRLAVAVAIFWTAGGVASGVESIDVVWDLLGSSLSILLSHLIPCASYLVITQNIEGHSASRSLAWILILVFTPLMIISTANAIDNTFFA